MAPPTDYHFWTREIGTWMCTLIQDELAAELGLDTGQRVMFGDLKAYPENALVLHVPSVFVWPIDVTNEFISMNARWNQKYRFKVVWLSKVPEGTDIETTRVNGVNRIGDLLMANYLMRDPVVSGTSTFVAHSITVDRIDYKPSEDEIVSGSTDGINLFAGAVECTVESQTWNS